jgi:DNA modification methylase
MVLARQQREIQGDPVIDFISNPDQAFHLIHGDAEDVLREFPTHVIDTCLTSPPYWAKREYDGHRGLGTERSWQDYIDHLVRILREVRRVLKPEGSLWLNLGDTYQNKNLCGIPWRVAFALQEEGWILRNAIIWDKVKGNPCNAKDKLRNVHEYVFHFVQESKYFYDVDAIRNPPKKSSYLDGRIISPTGVSGIKYEKQIRSSVALSEEEKRNALAALKETLQMLERGEISDFRMIIRGYQRSTHSDSLEFSGRASEIKARGFCILPYHKNGTKPGDVWHIIPEDEWRKDSHYAVFPVELCEMPIKATCPQGGLLLDPFVGTGTSILSALQLGRRAIGIDTSANYLNEAERRVRSIASVSQLEIF